MNGDNENESNKQTTELQQYVFQSYDKIKISRVRHFRFNTHFPNALQSSWWNFLLEQSFCCRHLIGSGRKVYLFTSASITRKLCYRKDDRAMRAM